MSKKRDTHKNRSTVRIDMAGQTIGTWTVSQMYRCRKTRFSYASEWYCICSCGEGRWIYTCQLRHDRAPLCQVCSGDKKKAHIDYEMALSRDWLRLCYAAAHAVIGDAHPEEAARLVLASFSVARQRLQQEKLLPRG